MPVGLKTYQKFQRVEQASHKLGLKFSASKYGMREYDGIGLVPRDDELPIYSRDAECWYGDLDSVDSFLQGIEWAKNYYRMLGLVDDKKIARKEQDYRNKRLLTTIAEGKQRD